MVGWLEGGWTEVIRGEEEYLKDRTKREGGWGNKQGKLLKKREEGKYFRRENITERWGRGREV